MAENRNSPSRLVYDIGFNNGDDAAYYLGRGFRVLAVEANPALVEEGKRRFASEIASHRLELVNAAVWHRSGETVTLFVNETESGQSSLVPERGKLGGRYREVTVATVSIEDLFHRHGVPWYLKVDVEGTDGLVIRGIPRSGAAPKYLSFELPHGFPAVELLAPLGYTGFKLINPDTLTQSLPLFDHEFGLRILRKAGLLAPPLRDLIASLPAPVRPEKILWDPPRGRLDYDFSSYTTGPFGEETDGPWRTGAEMEERLESVYREYAAEPARFWYDLHARNAAGE